MTMNLALERTDKVINIWELGFFLTDEAELLWEIEYNKPGNTNRIELVEYVINHFYSKMNSIQIELYPVNAKHKRAFVYFIQHSHNMPENRYEKYLSKIVETKKEMTRLENEIKWFKYLVSDLYKLYPAEYSTQKYIESLEKKKRKLEEQIQWVKNPQQCLPFIYIY